jgi:hypothetical protein
VPDPSTRGPKISVCIPTAGKPFQIVQETADQVSLELDAIAELLVAPQGASGAATARQLHLPPRARVLEPLAAPGIPANWNRCIRESKGELIHLLHDDDLVEAGFYAAIQSLANFFPHAAFYATGSTGHRQLPRGPQAATGARAARLLLEDRFSCGSIVINRRILETSSVFDPAFPFCPDEEAYLRLAAQGGFAYDPRQLYRERSSPLQERRRSWHEPRFVDTYFEARTRGAMYFGEETVELARATTKRRVIGVALSVALAGDRQTAIHHLDRLLLLLPSRHRRGWRMRVARHAVVSNPFLRLVRLRRQLLRVSGRIPHPWT